MLLLKSQFVSANHVRLFVVVGYATNLLYNLWETGRFNVFLHDNFLLKGSPRTSTPFGSAHGRERGTNDMEKYYKPSMLQDPWADLQPISVTQTQSKCNSKQTNTSRQGRYYN